MAASPPPSSKARLVRWIWPGSQKVANWDVTPHNSPSGKQSRDHLHQVSSSNAAQLYGRAAVFPHWNTRNATDGSGLEIIYVPLVQPKSQPSRIQPFAMPENFSLESAALPS